MKNNHNFDQLMTSWGKKHRQLPLRNTELKQKALEHLSGATFVPVQMPTKLPWTSFVFAGLAAFVVVLNSGVITKSVPTADIAPTMMGGAGVAAMPPQATRMATPQDNSVSTMSVGESAANQFYSKSSIAPDYMPYMPVPPYYNQGVPITDTREFIKTDYNATIQTRDVKGLTRRVETTVRGFGGRVDSSTDSHDYGYVSFAVPATKFDAFRDEIESFVGSRFIKTETHTENLLPQKQSIEEQKKQIEKDLAAFKTQRQKLVSTHSAAVSSLQSQLNSVAAELAVLRAEQTTDPARRVYIYNREQELLGQQATLQSRLSSENSSYSNQLNYVDSNIKQTENNLTFTAKQDQTVLDNVATVRGTISLSWISVWEVVKLYISPNWMLTILIAGAVVSYFIHRRRYQAAL